RLGVLADVLKGRARWGTAAGRQAEIMIADQREPQQRRGGQLVMATGGVRAPEQVTGPGPQLFGELVDGRPPLRGLKPAGISSQRLVPPGLHLRQRPHARISARRELFEQRPRFLSRFGSVIQETGPDPPSGVAGA